MANENNLDRGDAFEYFGRSERWFSQMIAYCQAHLPEIRRHQAAQDGVENNGAEPTFLPASVLEHVHTLNTPEEVFRFLQLALPPEAAEAFADRRHGWLLEYADHQGPDRLPLIALAIVYSAQATQENFGWLGLRVGTIFAEYFAALEAIHQASQGEQIDVKVVNDAKVHRDAIEFFCSQLFGEDLRVIRAVLAKMDETFLYGWEELDSAGQIAMRDLGKTGRSSRSTKSPNQQSE